MQENNSPKNTTKKRIHFSPEDDLHLAREVLGQNPYEDSGRWSLIKMNLFQILGKMILERTLKDRIKKLVSRFLDKDKITQFKSGTEEEPDEMDDLLRNISDLMTEFAGHQRTTAQNRSSFEKGFQHRENALHNLNELGAAGTSMEISFISESSEVTDVLETNESNTFNFDADVVAKEVTINYADNEPSISNTEDSEKPPTTTRRTSQKNIQNPSRKRTSNGGLKQTTLNYLNKKQDNMLQIRSRELALQERTQALKEKKFELEAFERKRKLEMEQKKLEMEERKLNVELNIFKNQQDLIQIIFQQLHSMNKK